VGEPEDLVCNEEDLWRSAQPRFGVVRVLIKDGDYAITLDDLNSDHREILLNAYRRTGDRWRSLFYQDDAGLPEAGETHYGGWDAGMSEDVGGYGWTFGHERPGTTVRIQFRDELVDVVVDAEGWWMCVRETAQNQFDVPVRIG
jgi:hypothetical protein